MFITKIPLPALLGFTPGIGHARDALVWVSNWKTTCIEDIAYCLIGLLGIPFSIAYSEGNMAFRRLQEQILQHSHDMGLFAWIGQPSAYNSMLAEGPQCSFELSHQSPLSVGSFTALQLGPNLPFNSAPTMTTTSQNWNIPIKNYVKLGLKLWLIQVGICKWGSGAQLDIPTSAATSCPTSCLDSPALGLVVEIKNMRNFRPSLSPPPGPTKKLCKTKA